MRKTLLLLIFLLFQMFVMAQNVNVTGQVIDDKGVTLPGVSILVKGTETGTITDLDGNYHITVNKGATLEFSMVGMNSQQVVVGDNPVINVKLTTSVVQLKGVVVIGYGTQKKSDLTGLVTMVKGSDLSKSQYLFTSIGVAGKGIRGSGFEFFRCSRFFSDCQDPRDRHL